MDEDVPARRPRGRDDRRPGVRRASDVPRDARVQGGVRQDRRGVRTGRGPGHHGSDRRPGPVHLEQPDARTDHHAAHPQPPQEKMITAHRLALPAAAALLLLASAVGGQEVKLPAELVGAPGAWVIVAPQIVSGGKPKWRWDPQLQEVRLDALFPPEMASQATGKVFTSTKPGRYFVE